jgi:hypothetical protein
VDRPHSANGNGAPQQRSPGGSGQVGDAATNSVSAGPLESDSARTDRSYGSSRPPNAGAGSPAGFGYGAGDRRGSTEKRFSDSAKSFAIAYLATLAVGIVVLFIAAQVLG